MRFRAATPADSEQLFAWRNDPETRRASINTALVDETEHAAWFSTVLRGDREVWLAEHDGQPVGRVDCRHVGEQIQLGWTIAPEHRGRGLGKMMVKAFVDHHPGHYQAEIKTGNPASIAIAAHAGIAFTALGQEST